MLIKNVCGEAPMSAEHLPSHHITHSQLHLSHIADMVALRIHDHVFVRLLKSQHYIHKLQLSRHHYGGVR